MAQRRSRYRQMEWMMTYTLVGAAGLFVLYLVFSAFGVVWLKVITAILLILICAACLAFLFLTGELLKKRSFWMTVGAGAILICLLFSLLLNYPRPNPCKNGIPQNPGSSQVE